MLGWKQARACWGTTGFEEETQISNECAIVPAPEVGRADMTEMERAVLQPDLVNERCFSLFVPLFFFFLSL